ncbi:MAG: HEAT repeat domain-containing protein [Planctomycetes bacterium]|nr:HEAT repeat domain-containing protein [Planctomycetota bacterium]
MTGSYRKLGLALAALCLTAPAALAQDIEGTFKQAVDLLQRDRKDEALRMFQKVLSMEPSAEQAYALWTGTDHDTWLEILRTKGDIELIGRRMMALVDAARRERRNDADAIVALVKELSTDDPVERRKAIRALSADHGEYAVPHLLGWLGSTADEDNRTTAIQALTEMSSDVVLPLCAALSTDDAFLRRNIVYVLGRIGDSRAAGRVACCSTDADASVADAAVAAMGVLKSSGNGCKDLCAQGEAYHLRSGMVLADHMWSDVVWSWGDGALVATATPRSLYPDAMARACFTAAHIADATCADVLPGFARAEAGTIAAVNALAAAGVDTSELQAMAERAQVALGMTGAAGAEGGLAKALAQGDSGTAAVLVRALAEMAPAPTTAMRAALASKDGAIRSEAAVALGQMATWGKGAANAQVVSALGEVVGRQVVRLAYVIDADAARGQTVSLALSAAGMMVNASNNGVIGLASLRRMPGLDAVVVSDSLPDVAAQQVIDEIKAEPAFAKAAIFLVSSNPEAAAEAFGETVAGVLADPADVSTVTASMGESMGSERDRADALAAEAAGLLATLAGTGTNIAPAADALAGTLGRKDAVAVGAAYALCSAGNASHVAALAAVAADGARSEGVREAAARACSSIFARGGAAGEAAAVLAGIAHSDAPIAVRKAAAQAVGNLSAEDRAALGAAHH